MKGSQSVYVCTECAFRSAKWAGKCPSCGAWNTLEERQAEPSRTQAKLRPLALSPEGEAVPYAELELPNYMRSATGSDEFDRVLGGGLVQGSVVLLSGEPGIGKSTLLMQICGVLSQKKKVLYVSGEESRGQLKLRADRLGISGDLLYIQTETDVDRILAECDRISPDVIVVDSVQTVYSNDVNSTPGSMTQVKETALRFIRRAKTDGIAVILVGHVNKEGGIAGPKLLEHMVDAVLCFEGERQHIYRIIRAVKNRYGSTNEIGVFEMSDRGLKEVPNPSEMLLAGRPKNVSGNCAVCVMEGTRPLIAEVQALVSPTSFPSPKRTANGIDYNRMYMLIAVLEKRLNLKFSVFDTYLNVIGGLRLDEPASDLAVALSLISSFREKPIPDDLLAVGEIGLAGECRAVGNLEQRIKEAGRIGFSRILVPKRSLDLLSLKTEQIEIVPVYGIFDAIEKAGVGKS